MADRELANGSSSLNDNSIRFSSREATLWPPFFYGLIMVKVAIAGATGYTGLELLRLLLKHPEVEIVALTSEASEGKRISDVFPSLRGFCDLPLAGLGAKIAATCDVLFLCLPHTAAISLMPDFLKEPCKVIDLSADFRIKDAAVFEKWYHVPHAQPALIPQAVYGLPELHRARIKTARLIANPGCYPTSVILALAPLLTKGSSWVDFTSIIADSKSGVSGAGRKTNLTTQFAECNEGVSAYGLGTHRHTPEIEQELSVLANQQINISFSPHLIPMTRGILSTVYINLKRETTAGELLDAYRQYYRNEPFVRILDEGSYANTHQVTGSNYCDIGMQVDTRNKRVIITSAIDNLVKGASGQAVQNMNIMLGFDERVALDNPPIFP